jgi:hypothetical protein
MGFCHCSGSSWFYPFLITIRMKIDFSRKKISARDKKCTLSRSEKNEPIANVSRHRHREFSNSSEAGIQSYGF